MSVITTYADFRNQFTFDPLTPDVDGMPVFDPPGPDRLFKPFLNWQFTLPITIDLTAFVGWGGDGHWYIAQPTEGSGAERWGLLQTAPGVVSFRSTTAGGLEKVALEAKGLELQQIRQIQLRGVYIYARDVDEGRTYAADLWRCAFAADSFVIA